MRVKHIAWALVTVLAGCAHHGPSPLLSLRRVVLNQSGSGYFERAGHVVGDRLALRLKSHEVDDVLATLTVLEQGPEARQTVVAAGVPHAQGGREDAVSLDVRLPDARPRDLMVAYAVPTANWRATYRVVLPEREGGPALLQVWALVHNSSDEDWNNVEMTLATGAPLSFSFHLRTPSFTARPDATGALTAPEVNGVISAETADGDRLRNLEPEPTNRQGVAAPGGHRGADTDHDGVVDVVDRCPQEAETYNGQEDTDGCPDAGRVQITGEQIRILHMVTFDANSSTVRARDQQLIDALVSVLRANPQLRVEVQGNASSDESSAWDLALERAATVRARLISAGVDGERLLVRSFGATHPLSAGNTPADRARNRYVNFLPIVEPAHEVAASTTPVTVSTMASSASSNASVHDFAGATRFVVAEPVSVASGSAALVTIASRRVSGDDVYLYRPDGAAPASREHPYRAARLRNDTGMTLLPGPVALFSGGTFAGEGLLQRLNDGETSFVPYAIDPSTSVRVTTDDTSEPLRVVSVMRDRVTLEDTAVHRTRFHVEPGAQSPSRVYLRHDHLSGYAPRNLPPESEANRDADLVPLPLTPRRASDVTLEQTRPTRRALSLLDDVSTDLAPYLAHTPESLRQRLASVLDQRNALARADREAEELRERLGDVAMRNAELRETLRTLAAATDATRTALRARLTQQLTESMTRHANLSRQLADRTANASALRTQLIEALRGLRVEEETPPAPSATQS